ncbi:MAG: hypothetical protein K0S80_5104, partial [Neobacillus sp.]|nr:hypothetical protein [Neobacillus sp.]
ILNEKSSSLVVKVFLIKLEKHYWKNETIVKIIMPLSLVLVNIFKTQLLRVFLDFLLLLVYYIHVLLDIILSSQKIDQYS